MIAKTFNALKDEFAEWARAKNISPDADPAALLSIEPVKLTSADKNYLQAFCVRWNFAVDVPISQRPCHNCNNIRPVEDLEVHGWILACSSCRRALHRSELRRTQIDMFTEQTALF